MVKTLFMDGKSSLQLRCLSVLSARVLCCFYYTVLLEYTLPFWTCGSLKRVNNVYLVLFGGLVVVVLWGDVCLSLSGELKVLEDMSIFDKISV